MKNVGSAIAEITVWWLRDTNQFMWLPGCPNGTTEQHSLKVRSWEYSFKGALVRAEWGPAGEAPRRAGRTAWQEVRRRTGEERQVWGSCADFALDVQLCWGTAGSSWQCHLEPGLLRLLPNWPRTLVHLSLLFHPLVTHTPHSISATQLLFAFQNPVPCQLLWRACWPQPLALTSLAPHWIFRVHHRRTTVISCLVSLSISRTQAYLCHWFLISSWTSWS